MEIIVAVVLIGLGLVSLAGAIASHRRRPLLFAATLLFVALTVGWLHFVLAGAALLFDPAGRAASAAFKDGHGKSHALTRLPGGLFYGEPQADSSLVVYCTDGRTREIGYATTGMPIFRTLQGETGC